jgi:hypothetical protein
MVEHKPCAPDGLMDETDLFPVRVDAKPIRLVDQHSPPCPLDFTSAGTYVLVFGRKNCRTVERGQAPLLSDARFHPNPKGLGFPARYL